MITHGWMHAALLWLAPALIAQTSVLDDTWTVTINGQQVQVNPDGTVLIPNVSAADQFGTGGPGSAPDFLSDDFLQLIGVREVGGVTEYAFSERFQIRAGQRYRIGTLTITQTPPPIVASLTTTPGSSILTGQPPETTQMTTVATLNDGTTQNVTQRSDWTVYRTSNPFVATVGADGLVTTHGRGTAFITAVNGGTTAVARLIVSPSDPGTAVEGYVQREDGSAVVGATVDIPAFTLVTASGNDGSFMFQGVPALTGPFLVTARSVDPVSGDTLFGSSPQLTPVAGGTTDAGVIVITVPACNFEPALGMQLGATDDSVILVPFAGGFTFPYYGASNIDVWVSSNGNLQFGGFGDGTYDPFVPDGVVNGVPRVSPAFFDLNPSTAPAGGGVFVNQMTDRFIVTWFQLPEYSATGQNTIQATLYSDGRIDFVYSGLTYANATRDMSVAVSPGGMPAVTTTDYTASTPLSTASNEALIENFGNAWSNPFDLDMSCITFTPNAAGGFDVTHAPLPISPLQDGSADGVVAGAGGSPLPNIPLRISSSTDPSFRRTVMSGPDGRFFLTGLPRPGAVLVDAVTHGVAYSGSVLLRSPWEIPTLRVGPPVAHDKE